MKILIIGASGFLGGKLYSTFSTQNEVLGTYQSQPQPDLISLDVTDALQTTKLIKEFRPEIVIHTVALSDPDICEQNKDKAERINHYGTKNIVEACGEIEANLVYISTVYVFDGTKGNYREEDATHPINWYGETKLKAEQEVIQLPKYSILRFDKLYGFNGLGKRNDDLGKILAGKSFEVNMDQIRQPLLTDDVAHAIKRIQELNFSGILHLAGQERISKYNLTVQLARLVGNESLVIPIPEKQQIARRPKDASIRTEKAESLGIQFTPLKEGILQIVEQLRRKEVEGKLKVS